MNTLEDQLNLLTGGTFTSSQYDDWVAHASRQVVDLLKMDDLAKFSTTVTIPITTGLAISGYRIHKAIVGGYDCIEYPAGMETQIADSGSLHKASAFTPGYIVNGGYIKTYNGSGNVQGTLLGVAYPAPDTSAATTITGVPENLVQAILLQTAIYAKTSQWKTAMAIVTTYNDTDQDIELAQSKKQEADALLNSIQLLQAQYESIIKLYLGVQQKEGV